MLFRHCPRLAAVILLALAAPAAAQCVDYTDFAHLVGRESMPFAVYDLVAQGDLAYATTLGSGVVVMDLSDPVHPTALGNVNLADDPEYLVLRGNHVFACGHGSAVGLSAVDVTDPMAPVEVGYLPVSDGTQTLATHGDLLLVQRHLADTVDVVDAADPTAMTVLASIAMDGQALLSGGGDLFYALTRTHFEVWDLADPTSPVRRGQLALVGNPTQPALALHGTSVLMPTAGTGYQLDVVDVSDPDHPALTGAVPLRYYPAGVLMDGDLAYVPLNSGAVDIYDLTDLAAPTFLGSIVGDATTGAALADGLLVCAKNFVFSVYDVTGAHLAYPQVGNYNWGWGFSYSAERNGDHIYVGGNLGLQVFDVSDYTGPVNTFGTGGNASVAMAGGILYVGDTDGLTVYGLDDPATPTVLNTLGRPWWPGLPDLAISGNLLIADIGDSLVTFDLSTPAAPQRLGGRPFQADALEVVGDLIYAISDTALHILDLADPVTLRQLGQTPQPGCEDLAVSGGYAYACYGAYDLLWIMDVRDPAAPTFATSHSGIYIRGLSGHGDMLLATQGGWGVQLLDLADPVNPTYAGHLYHGYDTGWTYRTRVVGDLVWLGSDEGVAFLPAPCLDSVSPVVEQTVPARDALRLAAHPNPFNPRTTIRFEVPRPATVDLDIFDLRGRRVRRLMSGKGVGAGAHAVTWLGDDDSGRPLGSGIYLARMRADDRQATRKLTLVR